jgi:hypothetical protein
MIAMLIAGTQSPMERLAKITPVARKQAMMYGPASSSLLA